MSLRLTSRPTSPFGPSGRAVSAVTAVVSAAVGGVVLAAGVATAQPCSGGSGVPGGGLDSFAGITHSGESQQGVLPQMPSTSPTQTVEWLTGPMSPNDTFSRFGITGTDLGIMWDNGEPGANRQILTAFGDTVGDCREPDGEWRSNALLRSDDTDLSDGMTFLDPDYGDPSAGAPVLEERQNFARQIIDGLGLAGTEITIIPTAAIAVGGTQYINFMSVRDWGDHGHWRTNFSAIAVSEDNGETWRTELGTIRLNGGINLDGIDGFPQVSAGNENFQMHAYVADAEYVYGFGTPPGRFGSAHLSRVPAEHILDLGAYEYWDGEGWAVEPGAAAAVIPAPVSELSVHWNDYLGKFVALYADEPAGTIVLRTADRPEGPWTEGTVLITSDDITGLYAPYVHPWSSGNTLNFAISRWSDYNVLMMETDLDEIFPEAVAEYGGDDAVLSTVSLD